MKKITLLSPLNSLLSLLIVGSFLVNFSVSADDSSRRQDVEQLLVDMKADSLMDAAYTQAEQMMLQMRDQFQIQDSESEMFTSFVNQNTQIMREEMGWDKLKQPMVDIYVKHYTDKEITDMLAFYQSESGRSMVDKMPLVMQESIMLTQALAQPMMIRMQTLTVEFHKELEEHRKQIAD